MTRTMFLSKVSAKGKLSRLR